MLTLARVKLADRGLGALHRHPEPRQLRLVAPRVQERPEISPERELERRRLRFGRIGLAAGRLGKEEPVGEEAGRLERLVRRMARERLDTSCVPVERVNANEILERLGRVERDGETVVGERVLACFAEDVLRCEQTKHTSCESDAVSTITTAKRGAEKSKGSAKD